MFVEVVDGVANIVIQGRERQVLVADLLVHEEEEVDRDGPFLGKPEVSASKIGKARAPKIVFQAVTAKTRTAVKGATITPLEAAGGRPSV